MAAPLPLRIMLHLIRGSGLAVVALTDAMESEDEFFASANTLSTVEAHLGVMAYWICHLPPEAQARWKNLDWYGWAHIHNALSTQKQPRREEIWYAIRSLLPASLEILRPERQAVRIVDPRGGR